MRQVGTSMLMYADDNDSSYPTNGTSQNSFTWDDHLAGYDERTLSSSQITDKKLKGSDFGYNSAVYACPDDKAERTYGTDKNVLTKSYALTKRVNSPNASHKYVRVWARGISNNTYSAKMSAINKTSSSIAMVKNAHNNSMLGRFTRGTLSSGDMSNGATLHEGLDGNNYLMVDNSVHFLTIFATLTKDGGGQAGLGVTNIRYTMWDTLR